MQQNEPINESILSDAVRQDLKKERIDHMTYLPGMEVLDSDIGQQVLTRTSSYKMCIRDRFYIKPKKSPSKNNQIRHAKFLGG